MELEPNRKGLEKKFFELCESVVAENNLRLYDMDFFPVSSELRVFIYHPETMTAKLDDCVAIDHALTPFIDSLEWMPESLTLEVSSPGLFRRLRTKEHFASSINQRIALTLASVDELEGLEVAEKNKLKRGKQIIAVLQELGTETITCLINDKKVKVNFSNIKKANLEPEI
jgi:ribosome maturation factor RimP